MSQEPDNVGDNEYFEDENLAFLPADHPLMSRLQVALKKTLEQDHERVHLQLKEKETNLKKNEREREDTAVQLYEVQQNLAELHLNLEQTHQNYNLIQKIRVEAEQKLSVLNQEHQVKKVEIDQLMKNTMKAQDELSKLARTVKQIEDYNVQMKSEIAVMRRGTYRAEENISNQEKSKKSQDLLIDHLNEQKKKLNEQIVILEAQVLAQKDETKSAKDILKEAFFEMENINASKKNLLERWQKSLLEMQRRDKALQVAREALKVQYELNVQVVAELGGVNNEIKKEGALAETLAENLNRLTLEEKRLDDEKQKLEHDTSKLNAQIKILQQSLQSTEVSSAVVERENKKIMDQMNIIEENIMKIHTQSRNLYEHVIHRINEHKTLEKKSANLLKQAQEIGQKMQEKDIEKETYENEIARVDIDMLNTKNQIEVLKAKKRDVSEERKKKEETVATYELEIRQGHDINEKKQSEVGKLNKLHDEIMNSASEMSRGPMDAHIKHLWQQIKDKTENVQRLERDWIKKQTTLVKDQQSLDKIGDEISSFKTKKTVLEHKKMRLNNIYTAHEKDIRQIKIALKNLQTEMNRLNDGLSKNWHSELKLKNENFHVQSEFVQKLKELESGNVKLEVDIDNLKEEKADLLANIVEAERQLLLWERKIQLEREIQDALDPEIGQSEIKELKKDIHRMELRLNEIRKRQEQTIFEMERAVHKRDTIQLKYTKNDDITDKKANKENKTQVDRQIQNLRGTLAQTAKNNKDFDKKLNQLQAELDEKNGLINQTENAVVQAQEILTQRSFDINTMKISKIMSVYEIVKAQTLYRGFDNILNKKFKAEASGQVLRQRYNEAKEVNSGIIEVLRNVAEEIPQFSDMIEQMINV